MPISTDLFVFLGVLTWFSLAGLFYALGGFLYDLTHPDQR